VASQHMATSAGDDQESPKIDIPIWGAALLFVTVVVFALALPAIGYTYGMVVATLAAVEDPNAEFYMSMDPQGVDSTKPNDPVEPSLLPAKPKPITSSLRTTIRHLKERAGRWSRFRGLAAFLVLAFFRDIIVSTLTFGSVYQPTLGNALAQVVADVALAQLGMTWVHIVISEPSPKRWYKRIPSFSTYKKIFPAAVVAAVGSRVTFFVPLVLGTSLSVDPTRVAEQSPLALVAVIALGFALTFLIEIPAVVTFIRVAASMLPEDTEAIVPFDRTFGGKVTPAVLGGSGKIGLLEAWKSFDWPSRLRFVMVSIKAVAMQIGLVFVFAIVLVGELALITGSASPEKLRGIFDRTDL
jgi:hypothetical protein